MTPRVVLIDPVSPRKCLTSQLMSEWAREAVAGLEMEITRDSEDHHLRRESSLFVLHCGSDRMPEAYTASESDRVLAVICGAPATAAGLLNGLSHRCHDFVCCPLQKRDFVVRLRRLALQAAHVPARRGELIGNSPAFLDALTRLQPVARSKAPVLIQGETGSGKELFARAIHYNGPRSSKPFIPVNCSALPEHLFENEVFGHVPGAFTDARTHERGLLAEANHGTLFLDEVDMLAPGAQAKLLRFLQNGEYRPLGASKALTSDVRLIVASNANLRELVKLRSFREDLYHRLNVLPFAVPPLRERVSDIPLLASHFAARFGGLYGRPTTRLSEEALNKLAGYAWPGNVRELEGAVHRAVVFATKSMLEVEDITISADVPEPPGKDAAMRGFERSYLIDLLSQHAGNLSHSAAACGKDRRTLQRLLRKHGIQRASFQAAC